MVLFPQPSLLNSSLWRGLRIGLLGGSFNPPHDGHIHISRTAMRMLNLDCVWWLVSPQNPLKDAANTAPFDRRMRACENLCAEHPRIVVSDIEQRLNTVRTFETLQRLRPCFERTDFVWLMGYDNAQSFHRWHRWKGILNTVATACIARPPATGLVRQCPLRMLAGQRHIMLKNGGNVPLLDATTYWIAENSLNFQSSTQLRQKSS